MYQLLSLFNIFICVTRNVTHSKYIAVTVIICSSALCSPAKGLIVLSSSPSPLSLSPMCLQSVIMESKKTMEVPDRSLGSVWHEGCPKDTSRKLHLNFQVSTFLKSGLPPGFSTASSKCHPWSLRGLWKFLGGVLVAFDMVDDPRIHQGSYLSIPIYLPSWEVLHLLCVSRASSWSLRGRWWFLTGVLVAFDMVDVPRIHQGSCVPIFISLPVWEVLHLLCVSRASSWSVWGCWKFLTGV